MEDNDDPKYGEFSHAYDNGIDEHPGVFLYFKNCDILKICEFQVVCISEEAYTKLREYLIKNPVPKQMGF